MRLRLGVAAEGNSWMDPRDGDNGSKKGGTQAEMQLRIWARIRDWQRQARMDIGTRPTVFWAEEPTVLCRSRLETEKALSWLCS